MTSSALQSPKWQLIGMSQWCRSALCGHPLPALTDDWTHGAASRHTIVPISHTRPSPRSRSNHSVSRRKQKFHGGAKKTNVILGGRRVSDDRRTNKQTKEQTDGHRRCVKPPEFNSLIATSNRRTTDHYTAIR